MKFSNVNSTLFAPQRVREKINYLKNNEEFWEKQLYEKNIT